MRAALISMVLILVGSVAHAQDRSPVLRQTLVDLAYVLGESHALRQACSGPTDQHWRMRMIAMVDAEQPEAALDRRLRESFNTGFANRQSEFRGCGPGAKRAEVQAMARGRDLAGRLARAKAGLPIAADSMADMPRVR